jgi:tRNA pseudouridine synthase 10
MRKYFLNIDILEKAQLMLENYALCNHCLGRQFALLGYGLDNEKRGEAIKLILTMRAHQFALSENKSKFEPLKNLASNGGSAMAVAILKKMGKKKITEKQSCYLCADHFNALKLIVDRSLNELKNYEYATFLVGIELPIEVEEREDELRGKFMLKHCESMRNEFSWNIGKQIAEITKKETDYKRPDIVVLVNPFNTQVSFQVNPVYIAGRYRKLIRGIPQSKWVCNKCRGKGCPRCNWTGRIYPESVEEIICKPILEIIHGEDVVFHGAGREDVDSRMLGQGRPFVVEVKKPEKRFIDLASLAGKINEAGMGKVQVSGLHFASKDVVRLLKKSEAAQKLYKVIVEFDQPVSEEQLSILEKTLDNSTVRQQTPRRVLHRRADLTREKHIYKAKVKRIKPNRLEIRVRCQGGLYIKELITGDEGRTNPSVLEILKIRAVPLELDVLGVFTEVETKS